MVVMSSAATMTALSPIGMRAVTASPCYHGCIVSVRRTDQRQPGEQPPRRFVPRDVLMQAARTAPRIDAERFRADIDALIDPYCLSGEGTEPRNEERGR